MFVNVYMCYVFIWQQFPNLKQISPKGDNKSPKGDNHVNTLTRLVTIMS